MELLAAVVAAIAVLGAGWFNQPGRHAVAIRRYAELLEVLPRGSTQRKALREEIDSMVENELDRRRTNNAIAMISSASVSAVIAVGAWDFAGPDDFLWHLVAVLYGGITIALAAMLVVSAFRALRTWRKATRE